MWWNQWPGIDNGGTRSALSPWNLPHPPRPNIRYLGSDSSRDDPRAVRPGEKVPSCEIAISETGSISHGLLSWRSRCDSSGSALVLRVESGKKGEDADGLSLTLTPVAAPRLPFSSEGKTGADLESGWKLDADSPLQISSRIR